MICDNVEVMLRNHDTYSSKEHLKESIDKAEIH